MPNIILIVIILVIVGAAAFYVYKAKKSGKKCIGCPESNTCTGSCGTCNCGCSGCSEEDEQ